MSWWERAQVGDRVVCIDDDWEILPVKMVDPVKGHVYEITGFEFIPANDANLLNCIPVFLRLAGCGDAYSAACFRPVERDRTASGMKTIRKLLDTVPVKEDA